MREILFRGKRIDKNNPANNGKWFEGVYFPKDDITPAIIYGGTRHNHGVFVDPETVGQYTGLTDKNGKRIFEGDVCLNTKTGEIVAVKWSGVFAGFVWHKPKKENSKLFDFGELYRVSDKFEVIGNIHDNPELLKR